MPAPSPRLQPRPGGDVHDAAAARSEALHRAAAAQVAGHEIHVQHVHHAGLVGVVHAAHGKAAGDVDRGPEVGHPVIQPRDIGLAGQFAVPDQGDAVLVGECRRLRIDDIGNAATGTRGEQGADHRPPQSAGAAGHNDGLVAEIHPQPPSGRVSTEGD